MTGSRCTRTPSSSGFGRSIEAGHQLEVETLKKQVQELWSRLENQQHMGPHRTNGDLGDEVVRPSYINRDYGITDFKQWGLFLC